MQFYSEHNAAQGRYEEACRNANASNQDARQKKDQRIEDDLVAGGWEAIEKYNKLLDERWQRARCLAEYDGISIGRRIARRAAERLEEYGSGVDRVQLMQHHEGE